MLFTFQEFHTMANFDGDLCTKPIQWDFSWILIEVKPTEETFVMDQSADLFTKIISQSDASILT